MSKDQVLGNSIIIRRKFYYYLCDIAFFNICALSLLAYTLWLAAFQPIPAMQITETVSAPTWMLLVLLSFMLAYGASYYSWKQYKQYTTEFYEGGIRQREFRGYNFIPWHEIIEIKVSPTGVMILQGKRRAFILNLRFYDKMEIAKTFEKYASNSLKNSL